MLSKKLEGMLNDQLNFEFFSSNIYLKMSSWCEVHGYPGSAAFLKAQADEELEHMYKFFSYVNESDGMAVVGSLDAPPTEFESLHSIYKKALEHEKIVTKRINDLVAVAWEEKDFTTFNFLQWFVEEQHEEEQSFKDILDKFQLAGTDGKSLFFIDREMKELAASREETETGE